MTITLKKQLGLWFGGALVCVVALQGVRALAASDEKLSAEEVSRRFTACIDDADYERQHGQQINNLISSENQKLLGYESMGRLLAVLSQSYAGAAYDANKLGEKNGTAVVRVVPRRDHFVGKEFVCVKENGGYKIDLIATYGRWNNLSGVALAKKIYDFSGTILPDLPRDASVETSLCQTNLKQIALGIAMYTQDYDERLPPARAWSEVLDPYLKKPALFNCPATRPKIYGYAYNSANAGRYSGQFEETWKVVNVFDATKLSQNFSGGQADLSNRHKLLSNSGANVAFMDGHIKFIPASYRWNDWRFTFTPKLGPVPVYQPGPPLVGAPPPNFRNEP